MAKEIELRRYFLSPRSAQSRTVSPRPLQVPFSLWVYTSAQDCDDIKIAAPTSKKNFDISQSLRELMREHSKRVLFDGVSMYYSNYFPWGREPFLFNVQSGKSQLSVDDMYFTQPTWGILYIPPILGEGGAESVLIEETRMVIKCAFEKLFVTGGVSIIVPSSVARRSNSSSPSRANGIAFRLEPLEEGQTGWLDLCFRSEFFSLTSPAELACAVTYGLCREAPGEDPSERDLALRICSRYRGVLVGIGFFIHEYNIEDAIHKRQMESVGEQLAFRAGVSMMAW